MKKYLIIFLFSFCPLLVFSQEILNEENVYALSQLDSNPKFEVDKSIFKYVHLNYKRPEETINLRGNVIVKFIIEKDGSLSNFIIVKDLSFGTGEELIRVLKQTGKWNPGVKDKAPVRTSFTFSYILRVNNI
jgi:hypothetical protein